MTRIGPNGSAIVAPPSLPDSATAVATPGDATAEQPREPARSPDTLLPAGAAQVADGQRLTRSPATGGAPVIDRPGADVNLRSRPGGRVASIEPSMATDDRMKARQDTRAIQRAINSGRDVRLGAGEFLIDERGLVIGQHADQEIAGTRDESGAVATTLRSAGDGPNAEVVPRYGPRAGEVVPSWQRHVFTNGGRDEHGRPVKHTLDGMTLRDMALVGAGPDESAGLPSVENRFQWQGSAVQVGTADPDTQHRGLRLEGLEIRDWPGVAVFATGGTDTVATGNTVTNPGRGGLVFRGPQRDIEISDNVVHGAGDDAIAVNGVDGAPRSTGFRITGNDVSVRRGPDPNGERVPGAGIILRGVAGRDDGWNRISGNLVTGGQNAGIVIADSEDGLHGSSNVHVVDNSLVDAERSAVRIITGDHADGRDASRLIVEGNRIWGAAEHGVYVQAPAPGIGGDIEGSRIADNDISGIGGSPVVIDPGVTGFS